MVILRVLQVRAKEESLEREMDLKGPHPSKERAICSRHISPLNPYQGGVRVGHRVHFPQGSWGLIGGGGHTGGEDEPRSPPSPDCSLSITHCSVADFSFSGTQYSGEASRNTADSGEQEWGGGGGVTMGQRLAESIRNQSGAARRL